MKHYLFFLLLLFFLKSHAQQFNFDTCALGVVLDSTGKFLGTGFVLGLPRVVVTCEHVTRGAKMPIYFQSICNGIRHEMLLNLSRKKDDLSVMMMKTSVCENPMRWDTSTKFKLLDTISYFGFDSRLMQMFWERQPITGYGKAYSLGQVFDFIEFDSYAIHGFSGGPVLNSRGEVVAAISRGYISVEGGLNLTKAVSIKPATNNIRVK